MSSTIRDAFFEQARYCERLKAPFTQRLCEVVGEGLTNETAIERQILSWRGDPAPLAENLPLRVTAALHAIARAGDAAYLTRLYPPAPLPDRHALLLAARRAMLDHDDCVASFLCSPPQTNEVGRAAPLLAGFLEISQRTSLPLTLFEIGASAGLNLIADQYRYQFGAAHWGSENARLLLHPDWSGSSPPVAAPLRVHSRQGCDIAPVSIRDLGHRERLLAYVWPDQPDRIARLIRAIETASEVSIPLVQADAADWLEEQLAVPPMQGTTRVVFHSVVWSYLSENTRARIQRCLAAAGGDARSDTPLAWLRLEPFTEFELRLTLWPEGEERTLARSHPHGGWVRWHD